METNSGAKPQHGERSSFRDWIDPSRIYNIYSPAERWPFVWGLIIYPFIVMFILMTVAIILIENLYTGANIGDFLGIVIWIFMMAWVTAAVCICYRRLRFLDMSQRWIWLIVLPGISLILFLYLLLKSGPSTSHRAT